MKVRYTATASSELETILNYLAERNPAAAKAFAQRTNRSIEGVVAFPELAQMTDEPHVRRLPIGRFPFIIFYTIQPEEIVILHVRHGARMSPRDQQ